MNRTAGMSDAEWELEKGIRGAVTARSYEDLQQRMDEYVGMVEKRLSEAGITTEEVEALEARMQRLFTWVRTMVLIDQAECQQELERLPRLDAYQSY